MPASHSACLSLHWMHGTLRSPLLMNTDIAKVAKSLAHWAPWRVRLVRQPARHNVGSAKKMVNPAHSPKRVEKEKGVVLSYLSWASQL